MRKLTVGGIMKEVVEINLDALEAEAESFSGGVSSC
jgi:hypothetical protein